MAAKKRVKTNTKPKKKKVILPKVMSKLIDIALKDLRKAEKTKGVVIDMDDWYVGDREVSCILSGSHLTVERHEVCSVCFAGAVMAGTLGRAGSKGYYEPIDFPGNADQLNALNELRCGNIADAAVDLDIVDSYSDAYHEMSDKYADLEVPDYDNLNPEPFHKAMERIQKILKRDGL